MGYTCGRKLDEKLCHSIAMTCKSITDFHRKDQCAYEKSLRMGWIDKWFNRLLHKPYTEAECFDIATHCTSRSDFKHTAYSAWKTAKKYGWIETYTWFQSTSELRKANRKWSDADVLAASRKYTKLSEFHNMEPARYAMAAKRGLLNTMTWLARNSEVMERKCLDTVYAYEFNAHKTVYIGRSVEPHRRDIAHHKDTDSVAQFAKKVNTPIPPMKILHDAISYKTGVLLEGEEMRKYASDGWTLLNKAPAGSIGGLGARKRTKSYCMRVAKQYTSITDLVNNAGSVYNALRTNGWILECYWLKYKKMPRGYWSNRTKDELLAEAGKYRTRNEFMHQAKTVYEIVRSNGWMSEVFPVQCNLPKKVAQYNLDGTLEATHGSIADAARMNGVKAQCISAVCRGIKKTCNGYIFKYV